MTALGMITFLLPIVAVPIAIGMGRFFEKLLICCRQDQRRFGLRFRVFFSWFTGNNPRLGEMRLLIAKIRYFDEMFNTTY